MAKIVFGSIGEQHALFLEEAHHETIFRLVTTGDHSALVGKMVQGVSFPGTKTETIPPQYDAVLKIEEHEVPVVMGEMQSIMLQALAPAPVFEA